MNALASNPGEAQPPVHNGVRHAALLLHAVSDNDRSWLLAAMTPEQRGVLEALLAELSALGVSPAAGLSAGLFAAATGSAKTAGERLAQPPVPAPASWRDPALLSPARLASLLRDEPDRLVAMVLARLDAPLRRRVLRHLPGTSRRRSGERMTEAALQHPAPRLEAMLLTALLREVADRVPTPLPTVRHRAVARVSSTWRRLAPDRAAARAESH